MAGMSNTKRFLRALFYEKPDKTHILVWTAPAKTSYWFTDVDTAAAEVEKMPPGQNVYVGVGLSPKSYGPKGRCKAAAIKGIAGLWADIDIKGPAHKKDNLPETVDEAMDLLAETGLEPTIVVDSGHGLQAWWLFREPWIFRDTDERHEAETLVMRWNYHLKALAQKRGWDVDATWDLARVLRVPGTYNQKTEPALPVQLLELNKYKYHPGDFDEYIPVDLVVEPPKKADDGTEKQKAVFAMRMDAAPPFQKFMVMGEIDPKFMATWERQRQDFDDQSPSVYDLSLATYAAMANWTDQEIVNLLIAHRVKHKDDPKLREDYFKMTIKKARDAAAKHFAYEAIEEIAATEEKPTGSKREAMLEHISALFGVKVQRIIKYVADPPQYRLETGAGSIMLGEVQFLISQNQLRNKMAAACGKYIPKFKGDKWDKIAQLLLDICDEEHLGDEATDTGMAKAWLMAYLEEKPPLKEDDKNEACMMQHPVVVEGCVHIFGNQLRKWLAISQAEKVNAKQMGAILRAYGAEPVTLAVELEGKQTTRGAWRLPTRED